MDQEQEQPQPQQQQQEQEQLPQEIPRIPFSREDLINAHTLRNTEFKEALLLYIEHAHLYASAKRALRNIVNNFFAQNWMLANFEKGGRNSSTYTDELMSARLHMTMDMLMATTSFCPSDTRSSDMLNIMTAIHSHFIPTLSRAKGPQREGIINRKQFSAVESTISRYDQQTFAPAQPQKTDKKPFLSFLGGKR